MYVMFLTHWNKDVFTVFSTTANFIFSNIYYLTIRIFEKFCDVNNNSAILKKHFHFCRNNVHSSRIFIIYTGNYFFCVYVSCNLYLEFLNLVTLNNHYRKLFFFMQPQNNNKFLYIKERQKCKII